MRNSQTHRCGRVFGLVAVILVCTQPVVCQLVTLELNLSDPGARSLGLGGAFVALADDATAAYANPAGLVQLLEPEVSFEGRIWDYSTRYTYRGRVNGFPTGIGIDARNGLSYRTSSATIADISFLSCVYPHARWSFALYRHQLTSFEVSTETNGLFATRGNTTHRDLDRRSSSDLDIGDYGLAAAYRVSDRFSIGLGLSLFDGRYRGSDEEYLVDDDTPSSYFGANSYLPERLVGHDVQEMDDQDLAMTFGFLARLSSRWQVGGFYRQGPDLDLRFTNGNGAPGDEERLSVTAQVSLPDEFGLGIAYRSPDGKVSTTLEWDRVEHSDWLDSLRLAIDADQMVDDGDELHLGAEYAFIRSSPVVAVRLGLWLDPDHRVYSIDEDDIFERALLRRGSSELHFTAGVGLAFERLQVDLGIDLAGTVNTLSLSTIFAF